MSKIITTINNFARGKADHDLGGRFDLPIFGSSADVLENFFSNFKGNAIFRTGLELIYEWEECYLIEFKFNTAQSYIVALGDEKARFLTYDTNNNIGWVESAPSTPLEIATPYDLTDAKRIASKKNPQNGDVMYIFDKEFAPRKLTRVSATSFTLATYVRTADPFDDPASGSIGWPDCGAFYNGFLYCAAPTLKPTSIYRTQAASYDDFTTGTDDDDGFSFTVADLTEPILWLIGGNNSLVGGSSQAVISVHGDNVGDPITPTTVSVTITNIDGTNGSGPIRKDNLLFYVDSTERRLNYFSYDSISESFQSEDGNFVSYDITVGKISKPVYIKDRNDLIYLLNASGKVETLNFNLKEKVVGWGDLFTSDDGEIIDIQRLSDNNGNINLFAVVSRDTGFFIERMANFVEFPLPHVCFTGAANKSADAASYQRLISELLKDCNFLDNSTKWSNLYTSTITYDSGAGTIESDASDFSSADVGNRIVYKTVTGREIGYFEITGYVSGTVVEVTDLTEDGPSATSYSSWYKTASEFTGLTQYANESISVVADGGYLGEFDVDGTGAVDLIDDSGNNIEVTVAYFGRIYEGLLKTFNLGFQAEGINTQITMKQIVRVWVRCFFSAGGLIGANLYDMEDIQEFSSQGAYDLPTLPIDGLSRTITIQDSLNREKALIIKQDKPLPLWILAVFLEVEYGTET